MTEATNEAQILQRYSQGEIGWREACKQLNLLSWEELEEMLAEYGLQPPEEPDLPVEEDAQRMADFVIGKTKDVQS